MMGRLRRLLGLTPVGRARITRAGGGVGEPVAVNAAVAPADALDEIVLARLYVTSLFCAVSRQADGPTAVERDWLKSRREHLARVGSALSEEVPRLPAVMPRLMAALRDPERTSVRELAALIETDPVLAGNVLKVVNSPAMRLRSRAVESLEQALVIMGVQGMREVVAAAAVSPIASFNGDPRVDPGARRELWPHTLEVATNVRLGATRLGSRQAFELFLAALSHGSGLMVLLRDLGDLKAPMPTAGFMVEFESLARSYSSGIAAGWGFAPATIQVLQAWARRDRSDPDVAMLSDAIAFTRIQTLCGKGRWDAAQRDAWLEALPDYAANWRMADTDAPE